MSLLSRIKEFFVVKDGLKFSVSAKAGTINKERLDKTDRRPIPFFHQLILRDCAKKKGVANPLLVRVDGVSQAPNGLHDGSLCLVDRNVRVGDLREGDTVVLKLSHDDPDFESYKLRMFRALKGDEIESIKFDKNGVPSQVASSHPASLLIGRVAYKIPAA